MKKTVSISEMARFCDVTAETIRRWIDSGEIPATRTVGGHRRIEYVDFVSFCRKNNIPLEPEKSNGEHRLLLIGEKKKDFKFLPRELGGDSSKVKFLYARDGFEAGYKIQEYQPDIIVMCTDTPGLNVAKACKIIRKSAGTCHATVVAVCDEKAPSVLRYSKIQGLDHVVEGLGEQEELVNVLKENL